MQQSFRLGIVILLSTAVLHFINPSFAVNITPVVSFLLDSPQEMTFSPGIEDTDSSVEILPTGSDISFGTNSLLKDLRISFAEGAVDESVIVSFGTNSGRLLNLEYGEQAPIVLSIIVPEGKEQFNGLVEISAPFDGEKIPTPIYIDGDNEVHLLSVIDVDWVEKRFKFITSHASWYSWVFPPEDVSESYSTEFDVGTNGFYVSNSITSHNPGGMCSGMTAFSKWYFDNKRQSSPVLYEEFRRDIGTDVNKPRLVQDVIASRAHISTTTSFYEVDRPIINSIVKLTDERRYLGIKDGLNLKKEPVMLFLGDRSLSDNQEKPVYHSVLAYGYTEATSPYEIFVYDPNLPNETATIYYDPDSKSWEPFEPYSSSSRSFDLVMLYGEGTSNVDESFENILDDANDNFNGSNKATVTIQSHDNGQLVDTETITLSGTVQSGDVLITEVGIIVNHDTIQQTQQLVNNEFQFNLNLNEGNNYITLITRGTRTHNIGGTISTFSFETANTLDNITFNLIRGLSPANQNSLNDTGITWGANYPSGNNTTCTGETISVQDCSHGRDATHNDDSDGHAGFSFTKLDSDGNDLPANAMNWSCVRDNVTGLTWEVKTDDGGLHDKDNTYRWGGKTRLGDWGSIFYNDWNSLIDGSNQSSFCGYSNWRLPSVLELESLLYHNTGQEIDNAYFPNSASSLYWTASPSALNSNSAWTVHFYSGIVSQNWLRTNSSFVRLVRSAQ